MQSLTDLNTLSTSAAIEFTDERTPDVIFDRTTATNYSFSIEADATHAVPVGINIDEIVNYVDNATTYTINISNISGATVTWPVIPTGCTVTNPSAGVYKIAGINSTAIWTTVKSPNVFVPSSFSGSTVYNATITYKNGTATKAWTLTVGVGVLITNMTLSRNYYKNSANSIFASNIPEITDTNDGTFTITLSTTLGQFKTDSTVAASTWTYSGTKAQVNALFNTINFYPTTDSTVNGTFVYTQYYNGILQVTKTANLVGNNQVIGTRTTTLTASTTWTPPYEYTLYGVDLLLVGGGGGGAVKGGGGGGGGVFEVFNTSLTNQSYAITVGYGGSVGVSGNASSGGDTSVAGYTAGGGQGGRGAGVDGPYQGGNCGTPQTFTGGIGYNTTGTVSDRSGGGAGAGANGMNGTNNTLIPSGHGGSGKLSIIDGLYYGGGGAATDAYNPTTPGDTGGAGGGGIFKADSLGGTVAGVNGKGGGGPGGLASGTTQARVGGSGVVVILLKGN